jgi:glutamine amidotransferase
MKIAVVDYGMGNLFSVLQAARHAAPEATIFLADKASLIDSADKVIFPGQGAMPDCMQALLEHDLQDSIMAATRNKPFLGICVGAQLLFEHSDEGNTAGLGIFKGKVVRFQPEKMFDAHGQKLKVPHMGWNNIQQHQPHVLWKDIPDNDRFYFVHSYHFAPTDASIILGQTAYPTPFASVVGQENIFAMQCHPEKSHRAGLQLLQNFVAWSG